MGPIVGPMNHFVEIKLQLASMDHNLHVKGKRGKVEKAILPVSFISDFISDSRYKDWVLPTTKKTERQKENQRKKRKLGGRTRWRWWRGIENTASFRYAPPSLSLIFFLSFFFSKPQTLISLLPLYYLCYIHLCFMISTPLSFNFFFFIIFFMCYIHFSVSGYFKYGPIFWNVIRYIGNNAPWRYDFIFQRNFKAVVADTGLYRLG